MLSFKDDDDLKGFIEHCIEGTEGHVEWLKDMIKAKHYCIKRYSEWLTRKLDAQAIEAIQCRIESAKRSIKASEDAIKYHRGVSSEWEQIYLERFGHQYKQMPARVLPFTPPETMGTVRGWATDGGYWKEALSG